jgi:hypothetical protein
VQVAIFTMIKGFVAFVNRCAYAEPGELCKVSRLPRERPLLTSGRAASLPDAAFTRPQLKEISMSHEQYRSCIDECYACAAECDHCVVSCLDEQDVKAMARCIRLDLDCAQICRMAAAYMARGSEFATTICNACAEICDACGEECARHKADHCQRCAEACRRCADECRRMASGTARAQAGGASVAAH